MKILNNLLRAIFLLFIVFIPVSASAEIFNTLPDITDAFQSLTKIRDNFYFIGNSLSNISNQTKKQAIEQTTSIINKVEFLQNAYEQGLTDKIQVVMEAVNIIEKNKAGFFDESNDITKQFIPPVEEIQSKLAKIFFLWKKQKEEKQKSKLESIENIDNKTIKKEKPINNNEQKENSEQVPEQVPVKEKIIERVLEKEILSQQENQRITNNEQNIKFLIEQINDLKKERVVSCLQKESSVLDEKLLLLEQELQNQIRLSANATTNQVIQVMAPIGNNEGAKKFTVQESIVNQGSFTQQGSATFESGIAVTGNQTFTGNQIISGDLAVNGGDITSTATIFNFDIGNTGTWNLRDGTNNLISVSDNGTGGILTVNTITPSIINAFTAGGNIDMATNIISNIGNAETDFTASGGLNLASNFIVNTNKFYVDASTGNVGIGTITPGALLDVQGAAQFGTTNINLIDSVGKIAGLSSTYFNTGISANLAGIITDETGSGGLVFANTPTLITPVLGDATYTTLSGGNITNSTLIAGRVTFAGTGGILSDDADLTFSTDTLSATKLLSSTSVSTPSLISIGAIGITPAAGSNLNIVLSTTGDLVVNTDDLYVDTSTGNVGIGITPPSAVLHLKAGTATASTAPLKFASGSLQTTAEAGAVEFLTDAYYGTITTGAARKTFAFLESPAFTTSITGSYL